MPSPSLCTLHNLLDFASCRHISIDPLRSLLYLLNSIGNEHMKPSDLSDVSQDILKKCVWHITPIGNCARNGEKADSLIFSLNSELDTSNLVPTNKSAIEPDNESVSMKSTFQSIDFNFSNLKGLKITNLNVNSLLKHIEEIRLLLSDTPFDILAINESKVDSLIPDYEIHVHNYSVVRLDRNRCGGAWCGSLY